MKVPGHGLKYLPLKKDGRVLFVKMEDTEEASSLQREALDSIVARIPKRNSFSFMLKAEAVSSSSLSFIPLESSLGKFCVNLGMRTLRGILLALSKALDHIWPMSMRLSISSLASSPSTVNEEEMQVQAPDLAKCFY